MTQLQNECIEWQGAKNTTGYGTQCFEGKTYTAHRVAAYKAGLISSPAAPKDRKGSGFILHICNNRLCINVDHMRVGTYAENNLQAYADGNKTQPQSKHSGAKLTPKQVRQIRKLKGKLRQVDLAARYNVTQRVISLVQRRKSYKDV